MTLFHGLFFNYVERYETEILSHNKGTELIIFLLFVGSDILVHFEIIAIFREGGFLPPFHTFLRIARELLEIIKI